MRLSRFLLPVASGAAMVSAMHGQATSTANQGIRLFAYGEGSYVRPDFGGAVRNGGATVGATANLFTLFPVELGLDVRAVGSGGRVSKQFFYGAGPRAQLDLGRLQPFAQFHIGYGKLDFQYVTDPKYTYDASLVKAYGGGADLKLSRAWALRGEVERQTWHFSGYLTPFYPLSISAGLRYEFHFKSRTGPDL